MYPPTFITRMPLLAQYDDEPPPPPPPSNPPNKPMNFSDLQQGFRDVHNGKVDTSSFRNGILILLMLIALVALFIHLRQRRKLAAPPDSLGKLGRELARKIHFPLGTKLLLRWVARSTQTPYPALLISSDLFDQCITTWSSNPNFAAARHWGAARLSRLRPKLFN